MNNAGFVRPAMDHCRIGSLEIVIRVKTVIIKDHCRIGSLEIPRSEEDDRVSDHCRIGSLEKSFFRF